MAPYGCKISLERLGSNSPHAGKDSLQKRIAEQRTVDMTRLQPLGLGFRVEGQRTHCIKKTEWKDVNLFCVSRLLG